MTTKAQRATAAEIMQIINQITDQKTYDEIYRVYGLLVPLADMVNRGWVTQINSLASDELTDALAAIRTIALHGTWQKPGEDVAFRISTDREGNITRQSELECCSNTFSTRVIDDEMDQSARLTYLGRPALNSRALVSVKLRELGFMPAHFNRPAEEVMRWVQNPHFTGYVFDARHIAV